MCVCVCVCDVIKMVALGDVVAKKKWLNQHPSMKVVILSQCHLPATPPGIAIGADFLAGNLYGYQWLQQPVKRVSIDGRYRL